MRDSLLHSASRLGMDPLIWIDNHDEVLADDLPSSCDLLIDMGR